jgi:DNA-binding transcriptional LysR family regulator
MELKWFEDYLELVAARNFSTAATARSISQSAFSRRINALENWVGAELIDRRTNPVTLTKAGELFFPRCREILHDIYRSQTECQQRSDASRKLVRFAALHTIALFFFPNWIRMVEQKHGEVHVIMHADNYYECIEQLTLGNSDFIMSYDHVDGQPVLKKGQGNRLNQLVTRLGFSESTARVVSEMECSHAVIPYCQKHAGFS